MAKKKQQDFATVIKEEFSSDKRMLGADNIRAFKRGYDNGHENFLAKTVRAENFYAGNQWEKADLDELKAANRPAKTINMTLSTINAIYGEYSKARADFLFKPLRGQATADVATALTKVMKQVTNANSFEARESEVFFDGLITGRGFFDIRMNWDDNPLGEVQIETLDPRHVMPDPLATTYDPAGWNEVTVVRWLTLDEIEVMYGKQKRRAIQALAGQDASMTPIDAHISFEMGKRGFGNEDLFNGAYDDYVDSRDRHITRVCVIDRQYYKLRRVTELMDLATGESVEIEIDAAEEAELKQLAAAENKVVRTRITRSVRWTVTCDSVVLHDEWSPYKTFTIVPYFCYFRRGKTFGVVENLIDPQETLNKIQSQILHVVNTTANSGWIVRAGSLINMTPEELEKRGAQTGLVMVVGAQAAPPEKIKPNQIPSGLTNIAQTMAEAVRDISGLNRAFLGNDSAEVSGIALNHKELRAAVQLQVIHDNLATTRNLVGKKVMELVQEYYTDERVMFIADPYDPSKNEELVINQQVPAGNPEQPEQMITLNDVTLGEYGVVITNMPARDTFEDSQFAQVIEMRNAGVMIPDHWVARYSTLQDKDELTEEIKAATGFGQPSELDMMMQEMQMQMMQLQMEDMMAKIEKTASDTQLNYAKAEDLARGDEHRTQDREVDFAKHAMELDTRERTMKMRELSRQLEQMQKLAADQRKQLEERRLPHTPTRFMNNGE